MWILSIHDPFLDLPKKRKIRFWISKSRFGFSPKDAPCLVRAPSRRVESTAGASRHIGLETEPAQRQASYLQVFLRCLKYAGAIKRSGADGNGVYGNQC